MANLMCVRDASIKWNISETQISRMCRDGRIQGAKKRRKDLAYSHRCAKACRSSCQVRYIFQKCPSDETSASCRYF